jgi:hypothetical protein
VTTPATSQQDPPPTPPLLSPPSHAPSTTTTSASAVTHAHGAAAGGGGSDDGGDGERAWWRDLDRRCVHALRSVSADALRHALPLLSRHLKDFPSVHCCPPAARVLTHLEQLSHPTLRADPPSEPFPRSRSSSSA